MAASNELCDSCGAPNQRSARTLHHGEGENTVAYHHYLLTCSRCGVQREDERLRTLNEAGAAQARALFLSS
jgi:ribosomal protein L37E